MPIKKRARAEKARAITDGERKFEVFRYLRRVRADKRLKGAREKKAREIVEENVTVGGRR